MQVLTSIQQVREFRQKIKSTGGSLGFIPTMGNLHAGHIALVTASRAECNHSLVSIFVNPMQFGENEDFDSYPRTLEKDQEMLREAGAAAVFHPPVSAIYPTPLARQTQVSVPDISLHYEGKSRPGHFIGVATVVCKLLNIIQPDRAYFGEKDFQQLALIEKMVEDLCIATTICPVSTTRDKDGLALSSRNGYLTPEQRRKAPAIRQILLKAKQAIETGDRDYHTIEQTSCQALKAAGLEPDYFAIVNAKTLQQAKPEDTDLVILTAAKLGKPRLLDNVRVMLNAQAL